MFLVGSKSNVSASFWLRFRMAWALFLCFSGFQKRRFGIFPAAVSQWLGHKTCWGSAFSHARPKHLFLEFGLVACRLPSLTLRKVGSKSNVSGFFKLQFRNGVPSTFFMGFVWWLAGFQVLRCAKVFALLEATFFFVFTRFQKQRFGIFLAAVSHGLGTISLFLVGSKSDVLAFFRLRFRNGLGIKPAGVLLFRMRVPSTFFLSLAWWLAGFQVLRCAKVCLTVSHGLGTICDCGRTVGYLTMAPLHGTSFAVCACRNRFAKGTARMLFLKAACNGYQSFVFYGFQRSV